MDTTAAEHEAVHAHAQVLKECCQYLQQRRSHQALKVYQSMSHLALSLETLPDEHAGALHPGNLAGTGSNLVSA